MAPALSADRIAICKFNVGVDSGRVSPGTEKGCSTRNRVSAPSFPEITSEGSLDPENRT
jgi:hypothetical protein